MIINYIETLGHHSYQVGYINLETRKRYTLNDEGEEQFLPLNEVDLQMILSEEVSSVSEMLESAMAVFPVTEKDQLEVKRLNNKLQYLLDYEYNNTK